ncbi:MAG: Potassium voltage-gated channel subfamily KQT; possible potassium channel, VIC family [uncultured Cytophagales bacterium]|uniref:Potassium voltage-gated channel subfamily KQT possible potassium channel, VIC family n=1 Tax=uncultured Cytophagales bacterium TaxID=158755 RepID=A0A6J4L2T3_9SPHI|nr:MAG: Potassium voltage-gated channel subfamily KQT; possible potassium channel, VIC family [uncultured Cytophagales bacterium]
MSPRRQVYEILKISDRKGTLSHAFDVFLIVVILLNALALILETVERIYVPFRAFFQYFDLFSILFFTAEYGLRVWTIPEHPEYRHPVRGRLRFILSPLALVDLLAFLPYYLPFMGVDLRFVRMLRIFRLFRVFRVSRYLKAFDLIRHVFRRKREELFISLVFVAFILVVTSCTMYFVEHEAQPKAFSSIPATMWWGVATLTTVGYGDMYPITPLGKFIGSLIAILGVGLVALPAGILASGFSEEMAKRTNRQDGLCPTCGQEIPKDREETPKSGDI